MIPVVPYRYERLGQTTLLYGRMYVNPHDYNLGALHLETLPCVNLDALRAEWASFISSDRPDLVTGED